jgi:hypothetical protein
VCSEINISETPTTYLPTKPELSGYANIERHAETVKPRLAVEGFLCGGVSGLCNGRSLRRFLNAPKAKKNLLERESGSVTREFERRPKGPELTAPLLPDAVLHFEVALRSIHLTRVAVY